MKNNIVQILKDLNEDVVPPFNPKDMQIIHGMFLKLTRRLDEDLKKRIQQKSFISNGVEVVRLEDVNEEIQ